MITAQQLENSKIHKCDNCNTCGHEKVYRVQLDMYSIRLTFTICKHCLARMCKEFRELNILMRRSDEITNGNLFEKHLNGILDVNGTAVFRFIGTDGSMGFHKNRLYRLKLSRQVSSSVLDAILVAVDVNSKKYCPYSSIDSFWENWEYVRRK